MTQLILAAATAFILGCFLGWLIPRTRRPTQPSRPATPVTTVASWSVGPPRAGRAHATINCPHCDATLTPMITLDLPVNHAVCFVCLAALELRRDLRVQLSGKYTERRAFIVGRRGNRPQVGCPVCQQTLTALAKRHGTYYAWCQPDRVIIPIGDKAFSDWRQAMSDGVEPLQG